MKTRINEKVVKQSGFTFIELVVVVVLIGLLAAVALPRFMEVTDDAQVAALQGTAGGFGTAIAMAHAQWKAEGNRAPAPTDSSNKTLVNMDGKIIYMNENGWPANTNTTAETSVNGTTAQECLEVWSSVLQSPSKATTDSSQRDSFRFFVSVETVSGDVYCRYELIINRAANAVASHFVDYRLIDGDVVAHYPQ